MFNAQIEVLFSIVSTFLRFTIFFLYIKARCWCIFMNFLYQINRKNTSNLRSILIFPNDHWQVGDGDHGDDVDPVDQQGHDEAGQADPHSLQNSL